MSNVTSIRRSPSQERPESLRSLLESGEDIEAYYRRWEPAPDFEVSTGRALEVDVWGRLLDVDVVTPSDPETRRSVIVSHREMVDRTLGDGSGDELFKGSRRRLIISYSWWAELLEDPELFERLKATAPAEAVATYERELAAVRAPAHPLRVELGASKCDACGEGLTVAITAEDVEGALWCVGCVEAVLRRARLAGCSRNVD